MLNMNCRLVDIMFEVMPFNRKLERSFEASQLSTSVPEAADPSFEAQKRRCAAIFPREGLQTRRESRCHFDGLELGRPQV